MASERLTSLGQLPVDAVAQLIVDRRTAKILALIELDDFTQRSAADRHRDRLTVAAGYLTIRLPAHERPTRQNVANCLRAVHAADPRSEVRHFG